MAAGKASYVVMINKQTNQAYLNLELFCGNFKEA
jgi:hypothetical protein